MTGTVENFATRGIENERAEVKLKTDPSIKIYIYYDLKRDASTTEVEWKINDQRLFLVSKDGQNAPQSRLICIEDGPLENVPGQRRGDSVEVRLKSYIPNPMTYPPFILQFKLQR